VSESLGARFREARESKGQTIEQIAAITKLNPHFIEALEDGRWDLLPGRVYLKSFAKIYAEALGIDSREVYEKIDGQAVEEKTPAGLVASQDAAQASGKKLDYKLPIVLAAVGLVVILIIIAARSRRTEMSDQDAEMIIPARGLLRRAEIKWERPWEKPAADPDFFASDRLTLETAENEVWACVVADNDTIFKGTMPPSSGKSFTADSTFRVSLSRNDKIAAYLNGVKVPAIGAGAKKLNNFLIKIPARDTTGNEAE
jgi:transcriptional regulator with XRE-family HTH domain